MSVEKYAFILLALCISAFGPVEGPAAAIEQANAAGVVVEEVDEASALAKAGLEAGDVLVAWQRLPSPPANPEPAAGKIESVFDWLWLKQEQAPRGTVRLIGQRYGEEKVFEVPLGLWDAKVRARLPPELLVDYLHGKELVEAGDLEPGIALWESVAEMAEWRRDGLLLCWLRLRIGEAWIQERAWEKADVAYRSALEATREPVASVVIWDAVGKSYERQSDFAQAEESYRSALRIRQATWGQTLGFASSLNNLGVVVWWQGELERGAEYYQRALAIAEKLAPDSLYVAAILNNLGIIAGNRGEMDLAAEYFRGATVIREKLAPGSFALASSLNNLGIVARKQGELDLAAEYYWNASEIWKKLAPESHAMAASLGNLGIVARNRGELELAAEYHQHALEIEKKLAPESPSVASSLGNLGVVSFWQGKLELATEYHQRSLEIFEKISPESLAVAGSLNNLGEVAWRRGELDRGAEFFQKSLVIKERLAPGSLDVAHSLVGLGLVAQSRGELEQAAKYFQQALPIRERLAPGSLDLAISLHSLGTVARDRGQLDLATTYFDRSIQALEAQVGKLGGSQDVKGGYQAKHRSFYRAFIEILLQRNHPEEAFAILERSRARSFLTMLAQRDLTFPIPEELARDRRRLAVRFDRTLQQLADTSPVEAPEKIEELQRELERLQRQRDDMVEKIRKDLPQFAALQHPQPLPLAGVRQILDPGTVMLSYSVGERQTDLFVVTATGDLETRALAVGEKALRRQVELFRDRIRQAVSGSFRDGYRGPGQDLYTTLIAPAAELVASGDRILIIPDGPLHRLPFAALIRETIGDDEAEGRDWQYLVEWKPIHSVLSATVYAELRKARRPPGAHPGEAPRITLAAFGDPLYPADSAAVGRSGDVYLRAAAERGFELSRLPNTREEARQLGELFPRAEIYLGAQATEERAKSVGRDTRILHFATHGKVDDDFPLNSFLALSIPDELSEDRDNGLLQVWEIFERLRLSADLVVLSACDSGLGQEQGGDGLIGLTRAFQVAGARSVAATLWSVEDSTTTELMVRFYRHLRDGEPYDEALRAAQLELIRAPIEVAKNGKPVARDASAPWYWAAFQIYGDRAPIPP